MVIPPRHIIQELQKENANAGHQNKFLESENKLLLSETEQLRKVNFQEHFLSTEVSETESQNMTALEGNVRSKILHEEPNVLDDALIPSGDIVPLQKAMREMRARYEVSTTHLYLFIAST